ncbi:hypothetical protein [Dapis sp. BLCC M229]|uniref:hypothetical protein n=1 Tax=Dapis sp. BLCC M229 TaxID=3400188 RepID=UPI003CE9F281
MKLETVIEHFACKNSNEIYIHVDLTLAEATAEWLLRSGENLQNIAQQISCENLENLDQRWNNLSTYKKSLAKYKRQYSRQREKFSYQFRLADLWTIHYSSAKYPDIAYATFVVLDPTEQILNTLSKKHRIDKRSGYSLISGSKQAESIIACEQYRL